MKSRIHAWRNLFTGLIAAGLMAAASAHAQNAAANTKYRPLLIPHFTANQTFGYNATADFSDIMRATESSKEKQPDGSSKRTDSVLEDHEEVFFAELRTDGALAREVFPNGSLREVAFLVNRCDIVNGNGTSEVLLSHGTVLSARVLDGGQVAFAVDGKECDPTLSARLSYLVVKLGDAKYTDNDLLGPPAPVAVGESWPVNKMAMLKSSLVQLFPGTKDVAGTMTLEGIKKDPTGQLLTVVKGGYDLGGVAPPFPKMLQIQTKTSTVSYTVLVDAPASGGVGTYEIHADALIHHQGRTGDVNVGSEETSMEIGVSLKQIARYILEASRPAIAELQTAPRVPANAQGVRPNMGSAPLKEGNPNEKLNASGASEPAPTPTPPGAAASPAQSIAPSPQPATPPSASSAPSDDASPFQGAQPLRSPPTQ